MVTTCATSVRRAAVIVVGDLARSPRMCRHASSLAAEGWEIDVFACIETPLDDSFAMSPRSAWRVHPLPPLSSAAGGSRAWIPFWALRQWAILATELATVRPAVVIVQNPPAVHILPLLLILGRWNRFQLIVDWHNFGWTMLGLRLGETSVLVRWAGWLERTLAARAARHVCVSEAMRSRLREHPGLEAVVVRDLPSERFTSLANSDKRKLRDAIAETVGLSADARAALLDGSGKLVVSSTSWSRDEDFHLLLDALVLWSRLPREIGRPRLIVVVSGRGPLRAGFERRVTSLALADVDIHTTWLANEEYPSILAGADLGVCMHRSTSGVDLPMKVADMLGAGLPLCAFDYGSCLREVLVEGENCIFFRDAEELMAAWRRLFIDSPDQLAALRRQIAAAPPPPWHDHWRNRMLPILTSAFGCAGEAAHARTGPPP